MSSFVYILESDGFYKIGIADDVQKRIRQLQTGNPHPIQIVNVFEIEKEWIGKFERRLHTLAKDMRVRGEWFELSDAYLSGVIRFCTVAQTYTKNKKAANNLLALTKG